MTDEIQNWLQSSSPEDLLMPLRPETKAPMFCHKAGSWSWEKWGEFVESRSSSLKGVGILMKSLICIDADTPEALQYVSDKWGHDIESTTAATTAKGMHFIFRRTELCNKLAVFDKSRAMKDIDTGLELAIDIKTLTSTGTAGVVAVEPSPGKTWLRAPWIVPPAPITDKMVVDLASLLQNGSQKAPHVRRGRPAAKSWDNAPQQYKNHIQLLEDQGFVNVRVKNLTELGFEFVSDHRPGDAATCPLCGAFHKTHFWYAICRRWRNYDVLAVKAYSQDCKLATFFLNRELAEFQAPCIQGEQICKRWLPPLDLSTDGVKAWSSGCNTGKSTMCKNSLQDAANILHKPIQQVRILLLATRIAFADSRWSDYRDLGFVHYKHFEPGAFLGSQTKLVITLQSLHRLQCPFGSEPPFDMLWIDEAESLMSTFSCSTTMSGKLTENVDTFERLFKTSRWVIWMDGTPTSRGYTALQGLCSMAKRQVHTILNSFPAQKGRTAHRMRGRKQLEDLVVEKVSGGERMEIVVGSRKLGNELVDRLCLECPEKSFLYYRTGMATDIRDTLTDINHHWAKRDVIIFTATILNGIDFHVEDHFDSAAVFGCPGFGPCTRDLMQMLHRVRHLSTGQVYFHIESAHGLKPMLTLDGIRKNVDAQARVAFDLASDSKKYSMHSSLLTAGPEWLREVHYGNILENNLAMVYADKSFAMWLEDAGYSVEDYEDRETVSTKRQKTPSSVPDYDSIHTVSEAEFKLVRSRVYARKDSTEDYWVYQRHLLDRALPSNNKAASIFNHIHTDSAFRARFHNLLLERKSFQQPDIAADIMAGDIIECGNATLAKRRGRGLQLVQQLCRTLGVAHSRDQDTEVHHDLVTANQVILTQITQEYHRLTNLQNTEGFTNRKEVKKHNEVVATLTAAGRVLYDFSGWRFNSHRRTGKERLNVWKLQPNEKFSLLMFL